MLKSQRMACKIQKTKLVGLSISKGKVGDTILLKLYEGKMLWFSKSQLIFSKLLILLPNKLIFHSKFNLSIWQVVAKLKVVGELRFL